MNPYRRPLITERSGILNKWVHLSCALWTPGVFFTDPELLRGITDLDSIEKRRFNLRCSICEVGKECGGACVQCAFGKC